MCEWLGHTSHLICGVNPWHWRNQNLQVQAIMLCKIFLKWYWRTKTWQLPSSISHANVTKSMSSGSVNGSVGTQQLRRCEIWMLRMQQLCHLGLIFAAVVAFSFLYLHGVCPFFRTNEHHPLMQRSTHKVLDEQNRSGAWKSSDKLLFLIRYYPFSLIFIEFLVIYQYHNDKH